ncbi:unnamed protein product [Cercopithifilaria johnstoni]|uniref:Uncharacterized protein n=1 Tax=Cercopithifilaria johnstoni TaxID=2874296 RepID=A0A8J2QAC7_9BILA|nr:unnamed protein product [Cercopithifilaria johnstoni]
MIFFIFLSLLIAIIQCEPLVENLGQISSFDSNDNITEISRRAARFKRQYDDCNCCCTAACCCVQRFLPPPITLPPTTTPPPIVSPFCCQIGLSICCQPSPTCCTQTNQVFERQQPIPLIPLPLLPSSIPMIGQGVTIQLSPQIVKPTCCNCCPCFGNRRKRRSLFYK